MPELYSNAEDCSKLAKLLKSKLKEKIEFWGSTYQEVVSGKYRSLPYEKYGDYIDYKNDEILFSYKFCENGFLRISIGDSIYKKSIGHKLAVLSDFYEVLNEIYGSPTLFYTVKDDDENTLNLQWSFSQKEEDIQDFKNGTAFDDAELDELIVFGEIKEQSGIYRLSDTTRMMISRQVRLPFELIYLVDENIKDFVQYKQGKTMSVPKGVRVDGYPIATLEDNDSKMAKLQKQSGPVLIKKKTPPRNQENK